MMKVLVMWSVLTLLTLVDVVFGVCNRHPDGNTTPKYTGDGGFSIVIGGSPDMYVSEHVYTGELLLKSE